MVLAQLIGVTNIMSAGVLTILCIQPSRKKSFVTAWHRFIACLLAIIFSIIFFGLLGYTPFALGLLLALFIPTTILLKIEQGRSEEHTSELQSRGHLVCRLLLEKKKKQLK